MTSHIHGNLSIRGKQNRTQIRQYRPLSITPFPRYGLYSRSLEHDASEGSTVSLLSGATTGVVKSMTPSNGSRGSKKFLYLYATGGFNLVGLPFLDLGFIATLTRDLHKNGHCTVVGTKCSRFIYHILGDSVVVVSRGSRNSSRSG